MGMIGDVKRLDTGLVADTVNTTSRIEGLTKFYGANILISSSLYEEIEDPSRYHFRNLGKALEKGRTEPLEMYECLDGLEEAQYDLKKNNKEDFELGLQAYYQTSFSQAIAYFSKVIEGNPGDLAAKYYLDQASALLDKPVEADWTGVNLVG